MFKSTFSAIITLIILIAIVVTMVALHAPWWFFIGLFFAYMSVFSNLMGLLIAPRNSYAGRTLMKWAYIFGGLFVVSLLALGILALSMY